MQSVRSRIVVERSRHELVDDIQASRISFRDRLQTKVGPIEAPRIRDWMIWEYGASFFPKSDRDNFGEDFDCFTVIIVGTSVTAAAC